MKGTEPGAVRQLGEIGLLSMMSIQISDHGCHTFVIVHGKSLASERRHAHPLLAAIFVSRCSVNPGTRRASYRMDRIAGRCAAIVVALS